LKHLGVAVVGLEAKIIDEERGKLRTWTIGAEDKVVQNAQELEHDIFSALVDNWRGARSGEQRSDRTGKPQLPHSSLAAAYEPNVVIDVPFNQGTLAIWLEAHTGHSEILTSLAEAPIACERLRAEIAQALPVFEAQVALLAAK
jgi:hypothetical protein